MPSDRLICGAKRRNGEPCRKLPMRNGRCHLHGGKTPRGRHQIMNGKDIFSTQASVSHSIR
ncbi:HGGxSTG domain-containing protein [Sphingobium indicum]